MSQLTQVFAIYQGLCIHDYGTAPCAAALGVTGTHKCHKTSGTCQDPDNFSTDLGGGDESTIELRFGFSQTEMVQFGPIYPAITSLDITPAGINLGGMDKSQSALGTREVVTVKLDDFLDSDAATDPYRLERITGEALSGEDPYNPYDRGTFWGKWLARNPYNQHFSCRAQQFDANDPVISQQWLRHYLLDRVDGPTNGSVTIVAKDTFTLIEEKKATAPPASRGSLLANLLAAGTSFTLSPSGIGNLDYPTSGSPSQVVVAIGKECIRCTRAGDVFTVVKRGEFNTEVSDHDAQDSVQWVLVYEAELAHEIVYDLLTNYSPISANQIDKPDWDAQAAELVSLFSGRIATPTPVEDLIGELAAQAGFTTWPEIESNMIRFAPLRPQATTTDVDDRSIIDGTLTIKRRTDQRVSQVWIYYGQVDPTKELDERSNYRSRAIADDAQAESDAQYGTPAVRELFSRWIPQFGRTQALAVGNRILAMFRDPPLDVQFAVYTDRAGDFSLARYFNLNTADIQDDTGAAADTTLAAVEIEQQNDRVIVRGLQVRFFTQEGDNSERVIYIENDVFDINLRAVHDSLYAAPEVMSPSLRVRFVILEGFTVGASNTAGPALETGTWPAGVDVQLQVDGRIQGAGGVGGNGSSYPPSATNGGAGGLAMRATSLVRVFGNGVIAGGGGGGGGGGAGLTPRNMGGGGGGGGGAGAAPGSGGFGGADISGLGRNGSGGVQGTLLAGGVGGAPGVFDATAFGGAGGTGGAPGVAGFAGGVATGVGKTTPGAGGPPGAAISGISFVQFTGSPSVQIIGSTS